MAYFPNGTSGMVLDNQCFECRLPDDEPCPVLWVQNKYNYTQIGNEMAKEIINCLVDKDGQCQMKLSIDRLFKQLEEEIDGLS